jgi:hypothetical protein
VGPTAGLDTGYRKNPFASAGDRTSKFSVYLRIILVFLCASRRRRTRNKKKRGWDNKLWSDEKKEV